VVGQRSGADQHASERENLRLQGQAYGMRGRALEGRIDELLERFRLAEAADRLVRGYSGGMERRLDVALGLVARPRVLFLDEPTTGLDPEVRAEMWAEIEALAGEHGVTVLLTTHYMEEADRLAACVAILDRGRIVTEGTPPELKRELRRRCPARRARRDGQRERPRAVPSVLTALEGAGVPVASVTVAGPSLEDVYLRHTGRSFEEAHR
jgi:ABC-2 type transport system ATP-binding protein